MRLVLRPCRKLLHSRCRGSADICMCPCHWEPLLARYGPPFPRLVPDGTVRISGGGWGAPPPRPAAVVRAHAARNAIPAPSMWRCWYWWQMDHLKVVFAVWRRRHAARSQGRQGLDAR